MFWRKHTTPEPDAETRQDTEAADALARQRELAPEVSRLAHVLTRMLQDNHFSPRIARLYTRDD